MRYKRNESREKKEMHEEGVKDGGRKTFDDWREYEIERKNE